MTRSEKRKAPRIQPYVAPCRLVHGSRRVPGYLTDLSRLGARVTCDEVPPVIDEPVVLEVRFSRGAVYSPLPAVIKWRAAGVPDESFVVGLTFSGVSAEQQRVLEGVIDEFRRRAALFGLADAPAGGDPGDRRRQLWHEGPDRAATGWLGLADDELLYRIEALPADHAEDEALLEVIRSERHFFIRQEAAKRIRDSDRLRDHAGDRHIGQILVRTLTRGADFAYLEKLLVESRHIEVRNAAEAQLRRLGWMPRTEDE